MTDEMRTKARELMEMVKKTREMRRSLPARLTDSSLSNGHTDDEE